MIRSFIAITFALVAAISVHAHSVWIEPIGSDQLAVRFAEPGSDFETSPGYLDNLSAPTAFAVVTNTPVAVEVVKKSDHFLLVHAAPANVACVETAFTVRGGRLPYFYARWQPAGLTAAATPLLTLDLVPTGKPGEVRAYFRGQPLGGVTATLRAPDEKETDLIADAEGFLHFDAKQSGQYLLTIAHHRESLALAGFHAGQAYRETSHNAALTWRQP
jgi:hypothetical protein